MRILTKFNRVFVQPSLLLLLLLNKTAKLFPDKLFLKLKFRLIMGQKLNLREPKSFNEKLQWLKLYNRKPEYTTMVDKYAVKQFVADKIGKEYTIPTLGIWDKFNDIDFDALPNHFVLKCTHDSGGLIICKDKSKLNLIDAKRKLEFSLKKNYYIQTREWPYKNVSPKIIAEQYMEDEYGELRDYKFYCFEGKVNCILVCVDRLEKVKYYYFDRDWNFLPYDINTTKTNNNIDIVKPVNFEKMLFLAEILSKGIPHVRIDLYNINGKILFGEYTFYTQSGFDKDIIKAADQLWGNLINLKM